MHISYLKRPLFILLIIYIIFILYSPPGSIKNTDAFYSAGESATIEGCLTNPPRRKTENITAVLRVKTVNSAPVTGKTYVRFPPHFFADMGECVRVQGKLREPFSVEISGNFNWRKYLANKNIYTEMTALDAQVTRAAPLFWRGLNKTRNYILNLFRENFDDESFAVLSGITLGEKSDISEETNRLFSDSGAMHLLVASGSNVGFVTLVIYALCAFFGIKTAARIPLALFFAGIYTLIAGADAPLLRAYLMTLSAGLGLMLGRNSGAFHGLITAAFLILIFEPNSIYEASFQMSFLATFIIIYSFAAVQLPSKIGEKAAFVIKIFLTTFAVQLALIPVYTNVFFKFSLSAFISNIFLVPLSQVVMLLAFIYCAASLIHLGFLIKWILWLSVWLFKILVHFFGGFSLSAITVPALNTLSILCFYAALLLLYRAPKKYIWASVLLLILSPALSFILRPSFAYALNNGRQNAIVIKDDKLMVFTDNFDEEIMKNFLLSKGYLRPHVSFGKQSVGAKKEFIPFKNFWPGHEVGGVKTGWGVMTDRNGPWTNTGYSGTDLDSVSYFFNGITIGGRADFVIKNDTVYSRERNKSTPLFLR